MMKKAAIFFGAGYEEIEALTLEVARLGMLDSEQTEEVLTEF